MTRATTEHRDTQIFQKICNVKFAQERNIFQFSVQESEILHVKHSAIEQSLLQVVSNQRNLIKLVA